MGPVIKAVCLSAILAAICAGYIVYRLDSAPDDWPELPDLYWGPGQYKHDDKTIRPFKINVSEDVLTDLKDRLGRWRGGSDPLEGVAFQYGFNKVLLKEFLDHWRTKYNWRQREKLLNQFPQYMTQVSGLDIHFLHVKPDLKQLNKGVEVVPLLLMHGWPGSIKEFYKIIPLLVTQRSDEDFVFEVIAPSLPGYGWSQAAAKSGLASHNIALIMNKLMNRLGFHKYFVQGGDWGSIIGANLAQFYPQNVIGYHTNMCTHGNRASQIKLLMALICPWLLGPQEPIDRMSNQISHIMEESGYMHIQATKPDTVGAALSDSPAGLAAYLLEKFSTWTNPTWRTKPDAGLVNYQKDDLLDNIMIYWVTNSITTSMRLYAETFNKKQMALGLNQYPITVPTGCARFPFELMVIPKRVIEHAYKNLIRFSDMPKGGHFAAFEVPDLLAEDIWQFTSEARRYHKHQDKIKQQQQAQSTEL